MNMKYPVAKVVVKLEEGVPIPRGQWWEQSASKLEEIARVSARTAVHLVELGMNIERALQEEAWEDNYVYHKDECAKDATAIFRQILKNTRTHIVRYTPKKYDIESGMNGH